MSDCVGSCEIEPQGARRTGACSMTRCGQTAGRAGDAHWPPVARERTVQHERLLELVHRKAVEAPEPLLRVHHHLQSLRLPRR
jgi:hypothetical protein